MLPGSVRVSRYLVPTPEVQAKLESHGVPAERIQVTGIPVHPKFWETHDRNTKAAIRRRFGLKEIDRPRHGRRLGTHGRAAPANC